MLKVTIAAIALVICSASALAADSQAGKTLFRQQCTLCHTAEAGDNGGAQGPELIGVFGRKAASARFSYTRALKESNLTWDAATLDRFLAAPTRVVPGTAMVVAVSSPLERSNLVAYFEAAGAGKPVSAASRLPEGAAPSAGAADWKTDKPGRLHHLDAQRLPAPFATKSASRNANVIVRPKNAELAVPKGFKVEVFASELKNPRVLRLAPNGDVFVSEPDAGRVTLLRPSADGFKAASMETFAHGLNQPYGLQFYPAGEDPKWLYVAELDRIVRFAYAKGDRKASGAPQVVVAKLAPHNTEGHSSRDLAFSADGRRMFVAVGSASNVAEDMAKKSPEEIKRWEANRGLGASWGTEENRADVLVFDAALPGEPKVFASGIRNCVGLSIEPANGNLWCTTNERDGLGDDLVPDYSTRVKEGGYYGWPWYYLGNHEEPRHKGERPELAGKALVPDVLYTAHSAALHLIFYTESTGKYAFPKEYVGDGFTALHGSWNRASRTGHKVVRLRMRNGVPTGEYEDFLTGFFINDSDVWGRPVDLLQMPDGSLLLSDDGGNSIFRIAYSPERETMPTSDAPANP